MSGPTPPGTGVIAAARAAASAKWTSPTRAWPFWRNRASRFSWPARRSSARTGSVIRLIPTSITTAPSLTKSPRTRPGRPTEATSRSASRQTAARSRVREWQTVTVAWRRSRSRATGLPTMFERPTTTARFPARSSPASSTRARIPRGVQATMPSSSPRRSFPALTGWNPSTSLPGGIASRTSRSSRCPGRGSWTSMPSTEASAASRRIVARTRSLVASAGRRSTVEAMPTARADFSLFRT